MSKLFIVHCVMNCFLRLFLDPHIKVVGRQEDVQAAKEKIMQILDTRVSLVIKFIFKITTFDSRLILNASRVLEIFYVEEILN